MDLAPSIGGSIARLCSRRNAREHHWLRPATAEALKAGDPLRMASFPLLPWCSRIRDGRSEFGGRSIHMPPQHGSPHALHGTGWQRPWRVVSASVAEARLALHQAASDWPYAFSAEQVFELDRDGLRIMMRIRNDDMHAMPLGVGHHPCLPHRPGTRLTVDAGRMWACDGEGMPTELERPPFLDRLRKGMPLAELNLDNNFIEWSRVATVDWPEQSMRLTLSAQPPFNFFVLYCPRGLDHFCIEPVSNCTDWMNLQDRSNHEIGGMLLPPGRILETSCALHLEWTQPPRSR